MKISSISLSQNFDYSDPQKRIAVVEFSEGGKSMLTDAFGHGGNAKHSFRIVDDYIVTTTDPDTGEKRCNKDKTLEKWATEFREQWEKDTDGLRTNCKIFNFAVSELNPLWMSFTPMSDGKKRVSRSVVTWGTKEDAKEYAKRQIQQNIDKKTVKVEFRENNEEAE